MSKKRTLGSYALQVEPATVRGGNVAVNGYKHGMVQVICATVAAGNRVRIKNAPDVDDTHVMADIFRAAQASAFTDNGHVFDATTYANTTVDSDLSSKIHGSLYLMPALAVRFGRFTFGQAGGCQIGENDGSRPIRHMLGVMEQFGIRCEMHGGKIVGKRISAPPRVHINVAKYSDSTNEMTGSQISGATKTALLCALGTRHTVIENAYTKTDVQDLVRYIKNLGCYKVEIRAGRIEVANIASDPCPALDFYLADCVSEVMTYIALAVHTQVSLSIKVHNAQRVIVGLQNEVAILQAMGIHLEVSDNAIAVDVPSRVCPQIINVTNDSIQSDHHPFFALMLSRGTGPSIIVEHVWRDRFAYVSELNLLGANFLRQGNTITIEPSLINRGGQILRAADTRAAAVCLLAALTAAGPTVIRSCAHLDRGYADLVPTLSSLGARITKVASDNSSAWESAA